MKNIPSRVFLQIEGADENSDFNELSGVSWCADKQNDNDIEYSLAHPTTDDLSNLADKDGDVFEIDFGGSLKTQVEYKNGVLEVLRAMDGYGNPIILSNTTINKLPEPPKI